MNFNMNIQTSIAAFYLVLCALGVDVKFGNTVAIRPGYNYPAGKK